MDSSPFETHTELIQNVFDSKKSFVAMGQLLSKLKRQDNFKEAVGEGIDTWIDYISQPEIALSKSEADRLIQIYEVLVEKFGYDAEYISNIPIKNLHYLLPRIKDLEQGNQDDTDSLASLLDDAKVLSQKDFKERFYEIDHHYTQKTYTYLVMKKCNETGSLTKVHGIESQVIKDSLGIQD